MVWDQVRLHILEAPGPSHVRDISSIRPRKALVVRIPNSMSPGKLPDYRVWATASTAMSSSIAQSIQVGVAISSVRQPVSNRGY